MKLYFDLGNFHALKVLVSSLENNKNLNIIITGHDERVVPHLSQSRLPVIEVSPGRFIFSSNVAASLLFPRLPDDWDTGLVDQWLEWESAYLQPYAHQYLTAALTSGKPDVTPLKSLLAEIQNERCLKHPLVGTSLSAADVCLWAALYPFYNTVAPFKALRDEFPAVTGWFDHLSSRTTFQSAVDTVFQGNVREHLKASVTARPTPLLPKIPKRKAEGNRPATSASQAPVAAEEATSQPALSAEEISSATDAWLHGRQTVAAPEPRHHPILPKPGAKNILITSALPYVNNVPHLGNIIGCVLSADVFSRFCRLRNYNSLYICGTDEYGTATETKAMEEGVSPQEICDKYNQLHRNIYDWFNIDCDYFGRTTTPQQTEIAQDIFWELHKNGYILRETVEQLQCQQCNRFLADRFVEGICPFCAYEDARGDQCDKCGKLINAVELRQPRCKQCKNTPVIKSSNHLFLDLPTLEGQLSEYLEGEFAKGIWTHNTKVISRAWIRDGLKPRCISRDLKWGTPVPLEGYTEKVFYVWYDAPIGYISITANYTKDWEQWWKNPKEVNLFNFMAKDNIPFHSVIFPCTLLGTKQPWTIVNNLSATEYLNYEDGKFSKSRGVGVFGNNAQDTGIPADIWRFYLLFLRPETQDSAFSWDDFVMKNNSELLNNLGNFINRALAFVASTYKGAVPAVVLNDEDKELLASITREIKTYIENLEKCRLRDGIRNMLAISRLGNQYIQANKPWVLVKGTDDDKIRGGSVIGLATNVACLLSVLAQPYMPAVSQEIQTQLQAPQSCNVLPDSFVCFLPAGHQIGKPKPLFEKIGAGVAEELKNKFGGQESKAAATTANGPLSAQDVTRLTAEVTKQGNVVRDLKSSKAPKDQVTAQVAKLLDLKKQLAAAQAAGTNPAAAATAQAAGTNPAAAATGLAAGASPPAAPAANNAPAALSPEDVTRLTAEVTKQGNVVRDLKAAKADKDQISVEVAKLLALKKQLTAGEDPEKQAAAATGGKKKKKGKK